jgi:hypothetical protein
MEDKWEPFLPHWGIIRGEELSILDSGFCRREWAMKVGIWAYSGVGLILKDKFSRVIINMSP